ncbi:MAG TPA: hypothetical protein VGD64_02650 [Acidisarcina sp.]
MDRAKAAEWLLRQVTNPVRASELVRDQLEASSAAPRSSFWLSIAKLLLAFSWRAIVGTAVSPLGGILLTVTCFVVLPRTDTQGFLRDTTVSNILIYLLGISMLLWAVTVFSLVRYGWRDTLTPTGLLASILWSASFSFFWNPFFAIVLSIIWVSFLVFCASSANRRRSLGILLCAVVAGWVIAFGLSALTHDPYSVFGKWQLLTALFLVPTVETSTTMFLHRKFIAPQRANS